MSPVIVNSCPCGGAAGWRKSEMENSDEVEKKIFSIYCTVPGCPWLVSAPTEVEAVLAWAALPRP